MTAMIPAVVLPEEPELGPQRYCVRCGEWWPFDSEFWQTIVRSGKPTTYVCRACAREGNRIAHGKRR